MGKYATRFSSLQTQTMVASLLGNMIPDVDMLYFHLIDGRRTNHHHYITHWPIFWICVSSALLLLTWAFKRNYFIPILAFSLGTMMHMMMDSFAAPILWLAPFSAQQFELVHVPATSSNWIVSFVTHWTFLVEIGICLAGALVFSARR